MDDPLFSLFLLCWVFFGKKGGYVAFLVRVSTYLFVSYRILNSAISGGASSSI